MKSKKRHFLLGMGAMVLALALAGFAAGGAGRTRSYFSAYRTSYDHAPALIRPYFAVADFFLNPVFETFGPFEPVWMQVEPGIRMQLDPYDMVSRKILETGSWEPQSVQAVADHLSLNATFMDVG